MRVRDLRKQKKGLGPCPGQGEDLRHDLAMISNVCGLLLEFNVLFPNKASVKICGLPPTMAPSAFECKRDMRKLTSLVRVIRKLKIESGQ